MRVKDSGLRDGKRVRGTDRGREIFALGMSCMIVSTMHSELLATCFVVVFPNRY